MGKSQKDTHNEYYVVIHGRVDEPTIFTSWGDAHPRVIYYPNGSAPGFPTLDKACDYMKAHGVYQYKKVIKQTALDTKPYNQNDAFYAVANGSEPGIYPGWYGLEGAFVKTNKWKGACHKSFRTEAQAEAFIRDWEDSVAEVCRMATKQKLDSGWRPKDMKSEEDLATHLRFHHEKKAVS